MARNLVNQYAMTGFFMLLLGLLPISKVPAEALQSPQQVIQSVSDTLQKKLQDKVFSQNFAQVVHYVNSVIEPHADFDKIAPLVLGKHWNTAAASEQERFKREFQILLVRAYSRAFVEYSNWTINYQSQEIAKDATKVMVRTKVLQPSLQPVEVNYRMFLKDGEWKVYDIIIEGVSLVTNYRSTFDEDIRKKGSLVAVIDSLAIRNVEALSVK